MVALHHMAQGEGLLQLLVSSFASGTLSFRNPPFHQHSVYRKCKGSLVPLDLFKLFLFSQTLAENLSS